jgi:hypothetical protein
MGRFSSSYACGGKNTSGTFPGREINFLNLEIVLASSAYAWACFSAPGKNYVNRMVLRRICSGRDSEIYGARLIFRVPGRVRSRILYGRHRAVFQPVQRITAALVEKKLMLLFNCGDYNRTVMQGPP